MNSKPVLLSVVGRKGSRKSEAIESLVRLLSEKGFRIGVIKHLAREDIEIDEPGKDTYRYRMQGASKVILSGRRRLAIYSNVEEEVPLVKLAEEFLDFDLVFLEDYFMRELPKIEIHKSERGTPLARDLENVMAICSNQTQGLTEGLRSEGPAAACREVGHQHLPVAPPHRRGLGGLRLFSWSDLHALANWIEETFLGHPFSPLGEKAKSSEGTSHLFGGNSRK